MIINKKAQNVTEYALLIAVVFAALMAMNMYAKRGIMAIVKRPADHLGYFGEMPEDIDAMPITQEEKDKLRAARVQELGIESNIDPKDPYRKGDLVSYWSRARTPYKNQETTISLGGKHRTDIDEMSIIIEEHHDFQTRIEGDEVSPPSP